MKSYLEQILTRAVLKVAGDVEVPEIIIEKPRVPEHGDAATSVALQLAGRLKKSPRDIAGQIVSSLEYDKSQIRDVRIAGPGFINFRFAEEGLQKLLPEIEQAGENYGKTSRHAGHKMQVEFVSANPTGPLTVGHGRNAVLGDTIARLMEWTGAKVDREYYFNNAGRQMRVLGESVRIRYQQILGDDIPFPEDAYQGEYIEEIARQLFEKHARKLENEPTANLFGQAAEKAIFRDIEKTLDRMNIRMDNFFNENELYESGAVNEIIERLNEQNLIYEKEGAVWFKTTEFGKDKDTVLKKSSGEPTYRLPDIAYHVNKLERGYDLCIDIFGADHIATYPDILSALKAMGYDADKVKVLVYQFVTLVKDGKPYKMSTRKANYVTLDELMDEVGADVTRFFFLMRTPNTHLEFDIGQAREAGEKNPVYYLQYAHARIKSIFRRVSEEFASGSGTDGGRTGPANDTAINKAEEMIGQKSGKPQPGNMESASDAGRTKAEQGGADAGEHAGQIESGSSENNDKNNNGDAGYYTSEFSFGGKADYTLLEHEAEINLIKRLTEFPAVVESAAKSMEPHKVINYLNDLAADFHRFYHDCRILGEEEKLARARMALLLIVARVLANGLGILGISAPDRM